jgi:hypothetical protein
VTHVNLTQINRQTKLNLMPEAVLQIMLHQDAYVKQKKQMCFIQKKFFSPKYVFLGFPYNNLSFVTEILINTNESQISYTGHFT